MARMLHLGELYSDTGHAHASRQAWREALTLCEDLGDPRAAEPRAAELVLPSASPAPNPGWNPSC
jgi:hypothetical protein